MSDYIEIQWTAGALDEARRVCRYLAQERLIASAQIIPWVESISMLDNNLETTQESMILLKTRLDLFEKVKKVILDNSTYEIPEIIFRKIDGGFDGFLHWLEESTSLSVEK